jgi:hypothetical protein
VIGYSCGKIESLCMVSHSHPVGFNMPLCMGRGKILTHHTMSGVEMQCFPKLQRELQTILWRAVNFFHRTKREKRREGEGVGGEQQTFAKPSLQALATFALMLRELPSLGLTTSESGRCVRWRLVLWS